MLFSPLEQFNILSFYDFALFASFDIFFSSFLISFWSFFHHFSFFFSSVFAFWPFSSFFLSFYHFFSSFFLLAVSSSSFDLSFFFDFVNFFFSFFFFFLSSFWSFFFVQLDFFYSSDHLFFSSLPAFFSTSSFDSLISFNLNLICTSFGFFFTHLYFVFLEFFFFLKSFFFTSFFSFFFSLSTKDFSYLLFSFNLSTIWQSLVFFFISFLFLTITWKDSLTLVSKNSWQSLLELFYLVIFSVVSENAGSKALKFFPLIFTTFVIILSCNVLGMIPYSFTVTSHLIVTFCTALAIFSGINILGIFLHRKHFLSLFFPPGAPLFLAPLLVFIEFVSYIFRVLSLSIRLFANLMSGHTLLKILASFSWGVVSFWGLFLLPVTIIFIVTGLEMAIAFLQAYIFSVLLCIYLNDAFNLH